MKWNKKYDYPTSSRATVDGIRRYLLGEKKLPSVTSILQATKSEEDKAALENWKQRVGYKEANKIYNEEKKVSERISINGLKLIRNNYKILTHCNTGALATTGPGTALGIVDYANKKFENINLYATETRPLNQGSRLTVWESSMKGIDCTLICDSMVSYIINSENIDIIIVGADRIAMNGDIANKIGTYQLAITANYHKIPFYVAAPISTFDMDIVSGDDIIIEERSRDEILKLKKIRISKAVKVQNPAFDVTPNNLISGIVTEKGIITKPSLKKIKKFFK